MRALADTSYFVAAERGRDLEEGPEELAVSVISIGELRSGVLVSKDPWVTTRRLQTLNFAQRLGPIPVDEIVADAWSDLVVALRRRGRSMPANDAWIAATALAHRLPVVTSDSDFDDLPGIDVIRW